ncbi:MAG: hypothetical protein RI953_295 [Pseudomonadota bacterium]|jgi:hypothetical protein
MKSINACFLLAALFAMFLQSAVARADDRSALELGLASSQYFQAFSAQAVEFVQGNSPSFPVFDPQRARGQAPGNGLPPCDQGGVWVPLDQNTSQMICETETEYRYCPSGTYAVWLNTYQFYCLPGRSPEPSYLSPSVLENDGLAIEGLKWFNRSQNHAALKFSQALQSLMFGNFAQAQSLRKEGCGQYNESTVALGATVFPANLQPVGFINSTLINDMMSALKATAAVVCP